MYSNYRLLPAESARKEDVVASFREFFSDRYSTEQDLTTTKIEELLDDWYHRRIRLRISDDGCTYEGFHLANPKPLDSAKKKNEDGIGDDKNNKPAEMVKNDGDGEEKKGDIELIDDQPRGVDDELPEDSKIDNKTKKKKKKKTESSSCGNDGEGQPKKEKKSKKKKVKSEENGKKDSTSIPGEKKKRKKTAKKKAK